MVRLVRRMIRLTIQVIRQARRKTCQTTPMACSMAPESSPREPEPCPGCSSVLGFGYAYPNALGAEELDSNSEQKVGLGAPAP
uniref:Uncharacterized protein n=1 Tax=Candidatus Kentrum sp. LPFa TaxID=2126335 RepID=A0A450WRC9_9GAMM|nr:MAG: hypothetical protein BECKLPF1236A_GA0070988_102281 [Candidatus Kentron sp. LPFa]